MAMQAGSLAVVLGGGGVAGIAWTVGVIAGLARAGLRLADANLFVGTSAGAVAGAQLACGQDVEALLALQLHPPADSLERFRPYSQAEADRLNRALFDKVGGDLGAARRRIGAFAVRSATPSLAQRLAIVAARLPQAAWPARPLRVSAVDVDSGERQLFDAASGCSLVQAVTASCAVPGTWPVVPIGGRQWMDGGIASMTHADAAAGHARVVVLSPFGYSEDNPVSGHLRAEVAALRAGGSAVQVIVPDAASQAAMGANVLDPARRPASAAAGLQQGLAISRSSPSRS